MSDPVSNREIEDVLSSIRRLVSVDKREPDQDGTQPVSPAHEPMLTENTVSDAVSSTDEGKLVLSPSFRVAEGDDHTCAQAADVVDADHGDDSLSLEQWQIHPSEQDKTASDDGAADHDDAAEHEDDDRGDPSTTDRELEARIAEVEAAVAAREDEWEPDDDVGDDYFARNVKPLPWEDYTAEDIAEPSAEYGPDEEQATRESSQDDTPEGPTPEPEQASQSEDEEPLDFVSRRDERTPQGSGEPDQTAQVSQQERERSPSDRSQDWYSDDAVLDEDALRDLVADIVRQELQGALGERITRNVRKLVRREIHRAMMGQDLD